MATETIKQPEQVKYQVVENFLRDQITASLRPGDRLPSFKELYARFGATTSTVNRALIALERDSLIVRGRGRGGVCVAARPKRVRHNAIGWPVNDRLNDVLMGLPHWTALFRGVQRQAHQAGLELVMLNDKADLPLGKLDAVLFYGDNRESARLMIGDLPGVMMLPGAAGNLSSVQIDDYTAQKQATEYLLSLGHRRIAYLFDLELSKFPVGRRIDGYRAALQEAGIKPDPQWCGRLRSDNEYLAMGRERMSEWLRQDWRTLGCTALMVQNDRAALGAMEALEAAGIAVPGDVSVMGFDSTAECEWTRPRLTSVQVPIEELGAKAVDFLRRQIEAPSQDVITIVLPTSIDVRESTAPPH